MQVIYQQQQNSTNTLYEPLTGYLFAHHAVSVVLSMIRYCNCNWSFISLLHFTSSHHFYHYHFCTLFDRWTGRVCVCVCVAHTVYNFQITNMLKFVDEMQCGFIYLFSNAREIIRRSKKRKKD